MAFLTVEEKELLFGDGGPEDIAKFVVVHSARLGEPFEEFWNVFAEGMRRAAHKWQRDPEPMLRQILALATRYIEKPASE